MTDHKVARSAEVDTGTLVDVDAAGAVVGIEVLGPQRCWPLEEILDRFGVADEDAAQLRAYFASTLPPAELVRPEHPLLVC